MAIEKRIGAYSAYAIAVKRGFVGTEEEWLESLIGPRGYQGWGVFAVNVSADGSLIFTIKNPETGETKDLEPIQIDTLNALNSISAAKDEAVNEVKETQTQATEAVDTAGNQALQDISDAKTSATGAVNTAGENAVNSVNSAGQTAVENAQTAITAAKNQAVSDVQSAGQSAVEKVQEAQTTAVEAVGTAQTNAVQAVENAGTAEIEKINGILPVPTEADAGKVPVVKGDGSGYELGRQIDDGKTSLDTTWSSQNIVSRLCPPFTTEGAIVTCQPVEGSTLNVLVQIEPIQEGAGDPSPENVRQIKGWEAVKLTHNEKEISIPLGQTVYGGTLDVGSGVLTVDRVLKTFSRSENWLLDFDESKSLYWHSIILSDLEFADDLQVGKSISSHFKCATNIENSFWFANLGKNLRFANRFGTTEEWKDYLISENSSGHPVQVVYYIATPVTLQLTPQEIRALSGVNTIYADAGDITVSGYSDPTTIIKNLADRIAALEHNAIGG